MIPSDLRDAVEMAKAVAKGEFRLLCPSMCLAPTLTNDPKDAELRGIGTIETTPNGGLRYHMAFNHELPPSHWDEMEKPPAHVESIYELYRFVAVDSSGREWRSTPVRGRFSPLADLNGRGEVVESLDGISYRDLQAPASDPSIVLIFPTPPPLHSPLPGWTRQVYTRRDKQILDRVEADHCDYQTEGCDVCIEHTNDDPLIIKATSPDAEMVPMGFEERMLDALALAMGRDFSPVLSLRTQGNHTDWHIYRGPYLSPEGMIRPPVLPVPGMPHMSDWSFAAAYQNKIAQEWPDAFGIHDPVSTAVAEIALGSRGTLQSASRTIAIGIEAIGNAVGLQHRYPPKSRSSLRYRRHN